LGGTSLGCCLSDENRRVRKMSTFNDQVKSIICLPIIHFRFSIQPRGYHLLLRGHHLRWSRVQKGAGQVDKQSPLQVSRQFGNICAHGRMCTLMEMICKHAEKKLAPFASKNTPMQRKQLTPSEFCSSTTESGNLLDIACAL